jgi:hypothetical protein
MRRCRHDVAYFISTYVYILNATDETWRPFALWPAQKEVLADLEAYRQVIVLKARQLGLTWLCLAYALWRMLFHPVATVGIFSRTETDAKELLDNRLKGMYNRLPRWMQTAAVTQDNKTLWQLDTGSSAMAFATNGGRQYTFSLVMVDEADFQPDLAALMEAVKPTVDAGGRMWLVSTTNKDLPNSRFKAIYREAKRGHIEWRHIFLPWHARPERTSEWYEAQCDEDIRTNGALDTTHQEYPSTDTEALAPRSLDKRIPAPWIEACYTERATLDPIDAPAIPNLLIWKAPEVGTKNRPPRAYVIGADPAEGNPTSDESALCVVDKLTGEQAAELAGRFDPTVLAGYAYQLARYYNDAEIMPERNNHGHAFIAWFRQNGSGLTILLGPDGKAGWNSNSLGKTLLYDRAADNFRDAARDQTILLHSETAYFQLASIEGHTLLAPKGEQDDRADAWALANAGRLQIQPKQEAGVW